MMRSFYVAILLALLGISCSDKDPLAEGSKADFSRLYVSFEAYNTSNIGIADTNIRVVSRADASVFTFDQAHVSAAKGGGLIYFNPFLQSLIHSTKEVEAINDPTIYLVSIGLKGELNNAASMRSSLFSGLKGITYHSASESLILVNQDSTYSGIHIVYRPKSMYLQYKPYRKLFTAERTLGATFYAGNRLFVLKTASNPGIYVYEGILTMPVSPTDSSARIAPTFTITLEDARQVYAMDYDSLHNRLAITDYSDGQTLGTGHILIYENFTQQANNKRLQPTRIITGPATTLVQPIAVALDTRASAQYLYVADRSKKILRFKLTDAENVVPNQLIYTIDRPAGITLDARDNSTLPK